MQNEYTILGLGHDANEAEIRKRYLELVRQFPPEREPQKAAEIRAAYDSLRDPVVRLENQLFDVHAIRTFDSLIDEHRPVIRGRRFPTELLMSLGRS